MPSRPSIKTNRVHAALGGFSSISFPANSLQSNLVGSRLMKLESRWESDKIISNILKYHYFTGYSCINVWAYCIGHSDGAHTVFLFKYFSIHACIESTGIGASTIVGWDSWQHLYKSVNIPNYDISNTPTIRSSSASEDRTFISPEIILLLLFSIALLIFIFISVSELVPLMHTAYKRNLLNYVCSLNISQKGQPLLDKQILIVYPDFCNSVIGNYPIVFPKSITLISLSIGTNSIFLIPIQEAQIVQFYLDCANINPRGPNMSSPLGDMSIFSCMISYKNTVKTHYHETLYITLTLPGYRHCDTGQIRII
ncbi:hypothetical protein AGLY_002177 [Aphis glycines]|uniref:Uncharacterized protein n=1 Tax=Aphis glycines TaxID=307491 RepID=A0A6G0U345_APHGL|nr:hypothetical protein AGLY_002177 [Aphis glycines]